MAVLYSYFFFFCFFKQKTAYEMRISDWSSDVCSSDLPGDDDGVFEHYFDIVAEGEAEDHRRKKSEQQVAHESDRDRIAAEEAGEHLPEQLPVQHDDREDRARLDSDVEDRPARGVIPQQLRSEERGEGKGCVRRVRTR